MAPHPAFLRSLVCDAMTKAAQVDSANDPNKSAPIPATSPTLSPGVECDEEVTNAVRHEIIMLMERLKLL